MRNSLLIFCLLFGGVILVSAQPAVGKSDKYSFGISPSINKPVINNEYESALGVGLGFYISKLYNSKVSLYSKSSSDLFFYTNEDKNARFVSSNIALKIGVKRHFKKMDNSAIVFQVAPTYVLSYRNTVIGAGKRNRDYIDLIPSLKNRFSAVLFAGFEFDFKGESSLQVGYSYSVNQRDNGEYIDAVPNNVSLSYSINFSKKTNETEKMIMKESLSLLQKDTLYIINRACTSDFSIKRLDSLFNVNYTYSAFRIVADTEVDKVSKQPNVIHFAVIGQYYGSKGDPATTGIYLLNKNLELTEHPYPYHTNGISKELSGSKCLGSLQNVSSLIRSFNNRLIIAN